MSGLSIANIVQVNVSVIPGAPFAETGCNKGLIIGSSDKITPADRVKEVKNLKELVGLGFVTSDPEYLAAKKYFDQSPTPTAVYIGRFNKGTKGSETITEAINACYAKESGFYGVYICGASDADISLAANAIEAIGEGCLFFETQNADSLVESPEAPDIFTTLKKNNIKRAIGIYSTTLYAGAALLGVAMGRETGLENSAFNLAYCNLNDVATEPITQGKLDALLAKNGNAYVKRGQSYELLHMGRCTDGTPYDDGMYLDMTKKIIQSNVMEVLTGNQPKVPQTDAGMAVILSAVTNALEKMRSIGYIAEGIWNGAPIKALQKGDVVAGGYQVFADSFATLSQAEREMRKAPPVWVALKTAGSVESVLINVNVNL